MKVTRDKNCYCYSCRKYFHYLGIATHRAGHRNRKERCKIMFTDGTIKEWRYERGNIWQ
jgi:hypothetical protein